MSQGKLPLRTPIDCAFTRESLPPEEANGTNFLGSGDKNCMRYRPEMREKEG